MHGNDRESLKRAPGQSAPLLIRSLFDAAVAHGCSAEIFDADGSSYSYSGFGERVHRLASALAELGLKHGMTVGVMDWDRRRYLECLFAVPMMGAVLHTINVRLSPEQILYTINHAEDDIVLVNAEFLELIERMWDRIEPGKTFVLLADGAPRLGGAVPIAGEYEQLLAAAAPRFEFPELDENTRATTFYTTGTTGLPKGVFFSHRQLVLHTLAFAAALAGPGQGRFNRDDVYMPITPMFHVHAWGLPYVASLLGAKQVYPGRYHPDALAGLIERHRVTFSHCVPTLLRLLLASAGRLGISLAGWKVLVGGAALPRALCLEALEAGIDVFTGYGMSETCPLLTLAQLRPHMLAWDAQRQAEIRCKTGRPIPFVQVRLVDPEMGDVADDGVSAGEIVVRAPWLTAGYLKDPAASATLWAGGWLHTGDVGVREADGYLRVTDRLKDVIKTGGEWVSSLAIEDLILRHPAVAEAAVIGVPDPKWSERPLAFVVLKPGCTAEADEIRAHLSEFAGRGLISRCAVPEQVRFVESLVKTSVGKLNKRALREAAVNA